MDERAYTASVAELARDLATDPQVGLGVEQAAKRLAGDGPNELRGGSGISPLAILVQQFRSLVAWLLIGAALVSMALGELVDGGAILAIVVLNAGLFSNLRLCTVVAASFALQIWILVRKWIRRSAEARRT